MGFQFENNGVNVVLRNPYFWGSSISQMRSLAKAINCNWLLDRGTLAIWPKASSRTGATATIEPPPGILVGYPTFSNATIFCECQYSPTVIPGGNITVKSSLTPANGKWNIRLIDYTLDSLTPHGRWFMNVAAVLPDQKQPAGDQG